MFADAGSATDLRVPHPLRSLQRVGYANVGIEILDPSQNARRTPDFLLRCPSQCSRVRLPEKKRSLSAPNYRLWLRTGAPGSPQRIRISCYAAPNTTASAAFIKESRMKFANATNLDRKSGVRGPNTTGRSPISANLFRMFFVETPTKSSS